MARGERHTEENIASLEAFVEAGGFVEGAADPTLQTLRVLAEQRSGGQPSARPGSGRRGRRTGWSP